MKTAAETILQGISPMIYGNLAYEFIDAGGDKRLTEWHEFLQRKAKQRFAAVVQQAIDNNWTLDRLVELFEYNYDQLTSADKSVEGIIHRAIKGGEDIEWIEEMIKNNPTKVL